jgi:hypothetical protein
VTEVELLIIDRDSKVVRRWARSEAGLVEVEPDHRGRHALDALPVELWTEDPARLVLSVDGERVEI